MSEPNRPAPPKSDRKGVEGGERDPAADIPARPQPDPGRQGGMIGEGDVGGRREHGRDGGMIGEG